MQELWEAALTALTVGTEAITKYRELTKKPSLSCNATAFNIVKILDPPATLYTIATQAQA